MIDTEKLLSILKFNEFDPLFFGSALFLFLFFGFLLIYRFTSRNHTAKVISLIIFSLYFYYMSAGSLFLMLCEISVLNYILAKGIKSRVTDKQKLFVLIVAVVSNLSFLIYFKYLSMIYEIFTKLKGQEFTGIAYIIPLGISYYIFKSLSYVFDTYNEMLEEEYSFIEYLLYISFFPSVLLGPIDKSYEFLPQIREEVNISKKAIGVAIFLLISGMIKKYIVADYAGVNFISRIMDAPNFETRGLTNLIAFYGNAIRIYCDFSGYTDFALAIALMLGFKIKENFNNPYMATSVAEFWRRWHISLSSWLSEYLFGPLQMAFRRMGMLGNLLALTITFTLCGIWHGANITFFLWGALHSFYMVVGLLTRDFKANLYKKLRIQDSFVLKLWQGIITFHLISIAWVIFSVRSLQGFFDFFAIIKNTFSLSLLGDPELSKLNGVFIRLFIGAAIIVLSPILGKKAEEKFSSIPIIAQTLILVLFIFIMIQFRFEQLLPPLYFKF